MHLKNAKKLLTIYFSLHFTTILYNCFGWNLYLGYLYKRKVFRWNTFFAEATAPNGIISYGSSNDSQGAANNMASQDIALKILVRYANNSFLLLCLENKILNH